MECNVGGYDRALRGAMLAGTLAFGFSRKLNPTWRMAALAMAGMEAFTILSRYCPMNSALGINTCDQSMDRSRQISEGQSRERGESRMDELRPEGYAG